jgi:hypothetical protein
VPRRSCAEERGVFISKAPLDPTADTSEKWCLLPLLLKEKLFFGRFGNITSFSKAEEKAGKEGKLVEVSGKVRSRMEMRVGGLGGPYKTCETNWQPATGFFTASQIGKSHIAFDQTNNQK